MTVFRRWVAPAALAVALTGCGMPSSDKPGSNKRTSPETTAMALEQLQGLPSLEDTTAAVRAAVDRIAAEAARVVPGLRWEDLHGESTDRCEHPYDQTAGQRTYLPDRVARNVAVSAQQWAQIEAAARRAAETAGAPTVQLLPHPPGSREINFVGQAGMSISVGYQGNLAISAYIGCRLPASEK